MNSLYAGVVPYREEQPHASRSAWLAECDRRYSICRQFQPSKPIWWYKVLAIVLILASITSVVCLDIATKFNVSPLGIHRKAWKHIEHFVGMVLMVDGLLLWYKMTRRTTAEEPRLKRVLPAMDKLWLYSAGIGMFLLFLASILIHKWIRAFYYLFLGFFAMVPATYEVTSVRRYDASVSDDGEKRFFFRAHTGYWILSWISFQLYLVNVNAWMVIPNAEVAELKRWARGLKESGDLYFLALIVPRVFVFGLLLRNFVRAFEIQFAAQFEEDRILYQINPLDVVRSESEERVFRSSSVRSDARFNYKAAFVFASLAVLGLALGEKQVRSEYYWFIVSLLFVAIELALTIWTLCIAYRLRDKVKFPPKTLILYLLGKFGHGWLVFFYEKRYHLFKLYHIPDVVEWVFMVNVTNLAIFWVLCCTNIYAEDDDVPLGYNNQPVSLQGGIPSSQFSSITPSLNSSGQRLLDNESTTDTTTEERIGCGFEMFLIAAQIYHQCMLIRILLELILYAAKFYGFKHIYKINFDSRGMFVVTMLSLEFHLEMIKMAKLINKTFVDEMHRNEYFGLQKFGTTSDTWMQYQYAKIRPHSVSGRPAGASTTEMASRSPQIVVHSHLRPDSAEKPR